MFVAANLVGNSFGSHVDHPVQRESKEKPLIGSLAGNNFFILVLFGFLESLATHDDSAQIGNVFTLGKFPFYVKAVNRIRLFIKKLDFETLLSGKPGSY